MAGGDPYVSVPPVPVPRYADWAARPLSLLRSGIPLTLLLDLVDPDGPGSELIYSQERAVLRV